jgi:pilus assembly protein Flp/PilA
MDQLTQYIRTFLREDDGAQIIEYALIIAAVSLILIVALQGLNNSDFTTFVGKVGTCLTTSVCS